MSGCISASWTWFGSSMLRIVECGCGLDVAGNLRGLLAPLCLLALEFKILKTITVVVESWLVLLAW